LASLAEELSSASFEISRGRSRFGLHGKYCHGNKIANWSQITAAMPATRKIAAKNMTILPRHPWKKYNL
jgi:hypothetical protein